MPSKRLRDGNADESDCLDQGQKGRKPRQSFASVAMDVMLAKSIESVFFSIEPMIRRVVKEEVEKAWVKGTGSFESSPQKQIQLSSTPSTLRLVFAKPIGQPVFTATKLVDEDLNPLQVFLVDTSGGQQTLVTLHPPIKLELVIVDGDFSSDEGDDWSAEAFENSILKEREGKRPLLTGDVSVTMRDGLAVAEELKITDNSSWNKCRKFRVGARVVSGGPDGLRIREALTAGFPVKDHRGELYKKSYPPGLNDEVWRLEKIGKGGKFDKRLSEIGIETVQDFLKLWVVDSNFLKQKLCMTERAWETTIGHAQTCQLGNKQYIYRKADVAVLLNPICQITGVAIRGVLYCHGSLVGHVKACVEQMVLEAKEDWDSLEIVDEAYGQNSLLQSGVAQEDLLTAEAPFVRPDNILEQNGEMYEFYHMIGDPMEDGQTGPGGGGYYQSPASSGLTMRNFYTTDMSSDDDVVSQRFHHQY